MRYLGKGRDDRLGLGEAGSAVRTIANMLAERLNAESAFLVDEEIDFVR